MTYDSSLENLSPYDSVLAIYLILLCYVIVLVWIWNI